MELIPQRVEKSVRSSRAGLFISKLLAELHAPKRPTYHLYGESAEGIRLPIDREAADQLADDVLERYLSELSAKKA